MNSVGAGGGLHVRVFVGSGAAAAESKAQENGDWAQTHAFEGRAKRQHEASGRGIHTTQQSTAT